jgi:hypothetical protein
MNKREREAQLEAFSAVFEGSRWPYRGDESKAQRLAYLDMLEEEIKLARAVVVKRPR